MTDNVRVFRKLNSCISLQVVWGSFMSLQELENMMAKEQFVPVRARNHAHEMPDDTT
jgi:hypothetical protein